MAPHGKELSENLKKIIVSLHKDGEGYKKIAKTLKLSGSTVVKAIQLFNRTGSTQNKPSHGRPKNLCFISRGSVWEIDVRVLTALLQRLKGQPVSAQNTRRTLHQIDLHGCCMDVCPSLSQMEASSKDSNDVWPIFIICTLHLTHPGAHTPGASRCCGARGAVGGSVPCSRVLPLHLT